MGLGRLLQTRAAVDPETRSTRLDVTNTKTGAVETFTIVDNVAPDWNTGGAYSGGMAVPGAWRAAVLLSDLLGSIPWHAYRARAGQPSEKVVPTPLLLEQPAPPDTRMTTLSGLALDLIWHGNAIGLIADRNYDGYPTALVPVRAESVQVKRVELADRAPLPVGTIGYRIGWDQWFAPDELVHVKGPTRPGALRGMGVLENHLSTLGLAADLARTTRSTAGGHGVPTGVLKSENPDLDETEAAALKAKWLQSQRTRTVAVLNSSTSFEALAWKPDDLQLVEARRYTLHELALIFGLPMSFLGVAQESRTYSNVEQESLQLVKFSLGGHLARFEHALARCFPRGTDVRANLDAILRADTLTRYQAHEVGIRAGFLARDEARALENRPPLTPAQRDELLPKPPAAPPAAPGRDDPEEDRP